LGTACLTPELQAGVNLSNILFQIECTSAKVAQRSACFLRHFFYFVAGRFFHSVARQGVDLSQQKDLIPYEQDFSVIPTINSSVGYGDVAYQGANRISSGTVRGAATP
jgi:hypothetical protein